MPGIRALDEVTTTINRQVWIEGRTACLAALLSLLVDYAIQWQMAESVADALRRNAMLLDYSSQMRNRNNG